MNENEITLNVNYYDICDVLSVASEHVNETINEYNLDGQHDEWMRIDNIISDMFENVEKQFDNVVRKSSSRSNNIIFPKKEEVML